ncbi:MAG: CoA transferase [Chloroflexi bacterium]|nr:CoA transferase [Chloroflexota bacterium]
MPPEEVKEQAASETLLDNYRVLDLTEGFCQIAGKLLGDLGADVIKVEPPGGSPSRDIGPFYKDIPHRERSLSWFAYNVNKRSMTLNLETATGKKLFCRLAERADVVLESFPPGYVPGLGLGYEKLSQINRGLIMVSITPFGQDGAKAHYKGSDLTSWASGGALYVAGVPECPPVWVSFPQASLHAGIDAVTGALIALNERSFSGEGQYIDVSTQEAVIAVDQFVPQMWDMARYIPKRTGAAYSFPPGTIMRMGLPCKDGHVAAILFGGGGLAFSQGMQRLANWIDEEGMAPEWFRNFDWVNDYSLGGASQETVNRVERVIGDFLKTKTKAELFAEALKRDILIAPVNDPKDVLEYEHLQVRDYWTKILHPELDDTLTYCGPFVKSSVAPVTIRRRPPLVGEHNREIYEGELGLTTGELISLKAAGVI